MLVVLVPSEAHHGHADPADLEECIRARSDLSHRCAPQFEDLWAPYYTQINNWIHSRTTWKTFKHSCGAIRPLLESFVACGFDVVNPVQIGASGMEPAALKLDFGDRVVFWGGGIDTQSTLPFGTPDQVRDEVRRNIDTLLPGGGFVFNAIHNIQAHAPIENLVAMIDAIEEYR